MHGPSVLLRDFFTETEINLSQNTVRKLNISTGYGKTKSPVKLSSVQHFKVENIILTSSVYADKSQNSTFSESAKNAVKVLEGTLILVLQMSNRES